MHVLSAANPPTSICSADTLNLASFSVNTSSQVLSLSARQRIHDTNPAVNSRSVARGNCTFGSRTRAQQPHTHRDRTGRTSGECCGTAPAGG